MNHRFSRTTVRAVAVCGSLSLGLLNATNSLAQPAGINPVNQTFEDDQAGFIAFGEGAKVGISRDANFVKNGNAALQFNYTIAKNGIQAMLLPVAGRLAPMKSLRFWIRADHTSPIAVVMEEGDAGARYVALFTAPKDKWQQVELAPEDFQLMNDAGSPKDPNNKLDLDQVGFVAIGDFGQFLLAMSEGPLAGILKVQTGAHTLYVDDFMAGTQPLTMPAVENGEVAIDLFAHPQLGWIGIGDVGLTRVENAGGDKPTPGMQIDYHQAPGKFAAVMSRIGRGKLRGTGNLKMRISSERAATLAVQLEEAGGGKYYTTLDLKGGAEALTVELGFDNFKASDDSKDQNGQLNPEDVQQIIIVDAAALLGQAENKTNVVRIGDLRAAP